MDGWIKLHRKIMENPMYRSERFTRIQAWIDLLLLANHKESYFYVRGNKVTVKRGQVGVSTVTLSERWQWARNTVVKFLNELEEAQQIKQQKTNVTTLISICNYGLYQDSEQQNEQQNDSRVNTNNNEYKDNNVNNRESNEFSNENSLSPKASVYVEVQTMYIDICECCFPGINVTDFSESSMTSRTFKSRKRKIDNVFLGQMKGNFEMLKATLNKLRESRLSKDISQRKKHGFDWLFSYSNWKDVYKGVYDD